MLRAFAARLTPDVRRARAERLASLCGGGGSVGEWAVEAEAYAYGAALDPSYASLGEMEVAYEVELARSLHDALATEPESDEASSESEGRVEASEGTCPRCKSKSTSVVELQTRSADEGATPFLLCYDCSSMHKCED
jgi:DNA-directed RNA polymerase subunit M/transcription elongation factor TFIIS